MRSEGRDGRGRRTGRPSAGGRPRGARPGARGSSGDERWRSPQGDPDLLPFGAPSPSDADRGGAGSPPPDGAGGPGGGRPPRRRSRRALRPLWWSLPVIAVMLAAAIDLVGLHVWSYRSGLDYQDGRYSAARAGYEDQRSLTAHGPERWVADYNLGSTLLAQGWLDQGVERLRSAMERVPRATDLGGGALEAYSYECRVRTNLALGLEAQGDLRFAAESWTEAEGLYVESSDLLAPCQSSASASPQSGGQGQSGHSGGQSGGQTQSGGQGGQGQSGESGDSPTDPGEQAGSAKDRVDQKAQDARDRAAGKEPSQAAGGGSGAQGGSDGAGGGQPSGGGSGSGSDGHSDDGQAGSGATPTPDPYAGETDAERQRREELQNRLDSTNADQQDRYDQNRPGHANGGW